MIGQPSRTRGSRWTVSCPECRIVAVAERDALIRWWDDHRAMHAAQRKERVA